MAEIVVYVKCNRNIVCTNEDVYLREIGSLLCEDKRVLRRCEELRIYHFVNQKYVVIDILQIIQKMVQTCPGIRVESLGEKEVILEPGFITEEEKKGKKTSEKGQKWWNGLKLIFVCGICFFGTGFTIMAFQNDIGINGVFDTVYEILMGEKPSGVNALQLGYAVGLFLGILLFFNHVGKKKISSDPTPIQVSLQNYEEDVNNTLVSLAKKTGGKEDA